jgi:prepilin-type N-terminal cleavage/methylation domain-containing protein
MNLVADCKYNSPGRTRLARVAAIGLTKSTGFTLIELLVVVSIIGVMLALLLAALQSAREAARMTQCRNNLKQLAITFHHFESAERYFPGHGGERQPINAIFGPERVGAAQGMTVTGNWLLQSLNYMEDGLLADVLIAAAKDASKREEARIAVTVPVPILNCPTRREPAAYPLINKEKEAFGEFGARTDYAMNGGSSTEEGIHKVSASVAPQIEVEHDGMWALGRHISPQHIPDGLTRTYMIGEKAMDALLYTTGTDRGDRSPIAGLTDNIGAANSYVRFAASPAARDRPGNCLVCHDFGSAHPTAWNMAMADGSVRSLSYTMDIKVHRSLASIYGGETWEAE